MTAKNPVVRPAALLLDLDGTLIDSEAAHWQTAREVIARHGGDLPDADAPQYIGFGEVGFWEAMRARFGIAASIAELADERSSAIEAYAAKVRVQTRPFAKELLAAARDKGIKTILASASPRRQIDAMLKSAGIAEALDDTVSGHDDVQASKPAPDVYLEAARRAQTTPSACWLIEDSMTGLSAARAAGGGFIVGVPTAATKSQALLADALFADLSPVVAMVRAL